MKNVKRLVIAQSKLIFLVLFMIGCSSVPKNPNGIENACDILKTHKTWEKSFYRAQDKYNVPPYVIMAIIYQESKFVYDAKPPKKTFLGIPTVRPSNAYGYAQALDDTWDWYRDKSGNSSARRTNLPDSVDFVGWYINANYARTGIAKNNAREQYLAYHEGTGGYLKKTYRNKPWLMEVANKVDRNAKKYRNQLVSCYTRKL